MISTQISPRFYETIVKEAGNKRDAAKRLHLTIAEGLKSKKFTADQVSIAGIGYALGVLDPHSPHGSFEQLLAESRTMDPGQINEHVIYSESASGLMTNAFNTITSELISSMVMDGYQDESNYIGSKLCRTIPAKRRNQKIVGLTALGGPLEVGENQPYSETDFTEKFVTTEEVKKGRIISLTEELVFFDEMGIIADRARSIGFYMRQDKERTIVRGVQDADTGTGKYVYRPSGTAEALYATDGSNYNYIGSGGLSGYTSAVPLEDWTDVDTVLQFRNTKVVDDRIDGTPQPIAGLNGMDCVLLVPGALRGTASSIVNQTEFRKTTNTSNVGISPGNPVSGFIGDVLTSPHVDAVNTGHWYYGNFKKQFAWMQLWPLQTFVQGQNSEAGFDRDVALRVKVRELGGLVATDSIWVTKVLAS
ncbi:hypothetical protein AYO47_03865 [Planctomyces sp. SCGC AG-212-M04]|nr:hypothetical protein AYO47_03865 [Planctomyces sp. SCGC AG-212-M04]